MVFTHVGCIRRSVVAAIFAGSAMAIAASSVSADTADPIKSRRSNYKEIGGAFKTIGDEVKTGAPIVDVIKPAAEEIVRRGSMQMDFFPATSGPEGGQKTKARAAIWQDGDKFRQRHTDFIEAAKQLDAAIDSGELSAITAAHKALGKTCKSCHDPYREPE
jgi:cytochrome c556